ncbi:4Fe-4S cluster-binding domain-containing protein [Methylophilaceae bacterium]|jgi:organic radical activating enzyme|nr:4Fe-4S cluster-binding domain-containing protein [Methylophilaceae bacterium]|tara:strand:- start:2300 stop:3604 length:1305 start_codon:yes stop_codon:yes gene_type:complete
MSLLENYTKQDLITKIGAQTIPTIIYGAGVSGQALLFACRESGIKVVGFCDNNIKKKGKSLLDIEIIHTDDIKSRFPNANWLIASADITDIRDHLIDYGYDETNLYPGATLLRDYNLENFSKHYESYNEEDNDKGFIEFAVASTIQCHDGYLDSSKVFMRSVDIVVTEKCTMKCVDCSNLMQYFEKPESYEIQEMNEAIEALCSVSDEIFEFRVIGGEPFVNKEVHLVVEKLIAEPKVKRIVIYTNGNVIPRDHQLECLKHKKVLFNITDYSRCGEEVEDAYTKKLSRFQRTTDKLEQICIDNQIDYRRHPPENWTDCGRIEKFNRTEEKNQEVFDACCCKNLTTLSKNELHRCPFSAQITRLDVCDEKVDYVDLTVASDISDKRNEIQSLLESKVALKACDYCPGRALHDPQITPAVQIKMPLPYEKKQKASA